MKIGTTPELLAPAGSPEALMAALQHGADAVYLGLKEHNARSNAVNFSLPELAQLMPIIQNQHGARVYVTLNTVIKTAEMSPILSALDDLANMGVDGIIFQDLGLAKLLKDFFPGLRRHASTQLAIHNIEGVRFCQELGINRVILARELTLKEICGIRKAFPKGTIELEVFCHGAMCYTYSGLCLFSGAVGGRSGNRGECAYTCRKGYKIHNERTFPQEAPKGSFSNYLFSMKDMNTLDILDSIVETGVDSLKIEGRRKGPDYVGATVASYRAAMQGLRDQELEKESALAFGRSYTKAFYLKGQFGDAPINLHSAGTRGILIGILDSQNSFSLLQGGIQRRDGINLVFPDRSEKKMAFNDYKVNHGNPHKPEKSTQITFRETFPADTQVFWIKSQETERKYQPTLPKLEIGEHLGIKVNLTTKLDNDGLTIRYETRHAHVETQIEIMPSTSNADTPLKQALFRFGDTPFISGIYEGPESVPGFIPKSKLKTVRRQLLLQLEQNSQHLKEKRIRNFEYRSPVPVLKSQPEKFIIRTDQPELLEPLLDGLDPDTYIIDFLVKSSLPEKNWQETRSILEHSPFEYRLALPMVLREWDLKVIRKRILQSSCQQWSLANPGQICLFNSNKPILHADFPLYMLNPWAFSAWTEMGITGRLAPSIEDDLGNLSDLLQRVEASRIEVIAYTDTPLFLAEGCSLAALYGSCPGAKTCGHETLHIENDHGDLFDILHDRCRSVVTSDRPLCWSGSLDHFRAKGVSFFRIDFCQKPYRPEHAMHIIEKVLKNQNLDGSHSENLYKLLL